MVEVIIPTKLSDKVELYYELQAQKEELESQQRNLGDKIIKQMYRQRRRRAFADTGGLLKQRYEQTSMNQERFQRLIRRKHLSMNQFYPKTPVYDEKAVEQALLDKELSVEDIKPCLDVKKGKVFLRRIKSENE